MHDKRTPELIAKILTKDILPFVEGASTMLHHQRHYFHNDSNQVETEDNVNVSHSSCSMQLFSGVPQDPSSNAYLQSQPDILSN